jgi:hypothetical protein
LKRLLRNLKYVFPPSIYDVDPNAIRNTLLYSKYAGAANKDGDTTNLGRTGEEMILQDMAVIEEPENEEADALDGLDAEGQKEILVQSEVEPPENALKGKPVASQKKK